MIYLIYYYQINQNSCQIFNLLYLTSLRNFIPFFNYQYKYKYQSIDNQINIYDLIKQKIIKHIYHLFFILFYKYYIIYDGDIRFAGFNVNIFFSNIFKSYYKTIPE